MQQKFYCRRLWKLKDSLTGSGQSVRSALKAGFKQSPNHNGKIKPINAYHLNLTLIPIITDPQENNLIKYFICFCKKIH